MTPYELDKIPQAIESLKASSDGMVDKFEA